MYCFGGISGYSIEIQTLICNELTFLVTNILLPTK